MTWKSRTAASGCPPARSRSKPGSSGALPPGLRRVSFRLSGCCVLPLLCLALLASGCSLPKSHVDGGDGSAAGASISRTALGAVGTRYKYGGAAPSTGFDCSGLVCWAYGKNGVAVPRTTREQSKVGSSVGKSGLRPGDLVVFKISSGLHTGIYTGKGKFVHSPSSGKSVRVDDINSQYWKNKFIAGRRHRQVY